MSNEISKEQKLTAIVLAHPAGSLQRPCALERLLPEYNPFEEYMVRKLYEAAQPLGFSPYECDAIIAGWDGASFPVGLEPLVCQTWLKSYELGQKLRTIVVDRL